MGAGFYPGDHGNDDPADIQGGCRNQHSRVFPSQPFASSGDRTHRGETRRHHTAGSVLQFRPTGRADNTGGATGHKGISELAGPTTRSGQEHVGS